MLIVYLLNVELNIPRIHFRSQETTWFSIYMLIAQKDSSQSDFI